MGDIDESALLVARALPYGVTLERTDRVDRDSIDELTLDLLDLAQELGGEYDGWETTVEK